MAQSVTFARRIAIEALVIVGSILLAFAIDAAWATRQEGAEVRSALESVRAELAANREYFGEIEASHRRVAEAGFEILASTTPNARIDSIERAQYLIGELWYRAGMEPPGSGAVSALIASGRVAEIEDPELRQALAEWPAHISRQQELLDLIYDQNSFHDRLVLFLPQLDIDLVNGMGYSEVARARFRDGAPPASRFPSDYEGLFSDRQFENGVTSRVTASLIGEEEAKRTQTRIDALTSLIARYLD